MRDLLIIAIVVGGAIWALRRPWIGVLVWTWLSIMNPHRYAWGIAYDAPLAAVAAGSTLLGLLMTRERQSPFQGAPVAFLAVLMGWITLSWLAGVDVPGDYEQWARVMKIDLMILVALMLLRTKDQIVAYGWVTAGSLALLGGKGGLFTVMTAGTSRVWGPPGSFVADNNHFALALIMTIPLLRFLQLQLRRGVARHLVGLTMLLCVAAAVGSYSRGALLAISAMGALFWWRSEKKAAFGIAIGLILVLGLPLMPEAWWARMNTIESYQTDASAIGRFNGWLVALEVAKHNFFGGGMSFQHPAFFSAYGVYSKDVIAAHSIYFQILGNHGFVGLAVYLMVWLTTYRWAGWLHKNARSNPDTRWAADLGAMVQVSLVGYAVGGAFLSIAYFDLPYNCLVMVVLARKWVNDKSWKTDIQEPTAKSAAPQWARMPPPPVPAKSPAGPGR